MLHVIINQLLTKAGLDKLQSVLASDRVDLPKNAVAGILDGSTQVAGQGAFDDVLSQLESQNALEVEGSDPATKDAPSLEKSDTSSSRETKSESEASPPDNGMALPKSDLSADDFVPEGSVANPQLWDRDDIQVALNEGEIKNLLQEGQIAPHTVAVLTKQNHIQPADTPHINHIEASSLVTSVVAPPVIESQGKTLDGIHGHVVGPHEPIQKPTVQGLPIRVSEPIAHAASVETTRNVLPHQSVKNHRALNPTPVPETERQVPEEVAKKPAAKKHSTAAPVAIEARHLAIDGPALQTHRLPLMSSEGQSQISQMPQPTPLLRKPHPTGLPVSVEAPGIPNSSPVPDTPQVAQPRVVAQTATAAPANSFDRPEPPSKPTDQTAQTINLASPSAATPQHTAGYMPEAQPDFSSLRPFLHAMDNAPLNKMVSSPVFQSPDLPKHIAHQMAAAVTNSADNSIEITLKPAELGRVQIHLMTNETGVSVNVTAERSETLDLMRRHIDQLAQEFQGLGFGQSEFHFGQGAKEEHPPGDKGEQTDQSGIDHAPLTESASLNASPLKTAQRIELDRVDIRI